MYYDHEVEFKSVIGYGMNDFCAHDLTFRHTDNDDQIAIIHQMLIVHDLYWTQSLLIYFNAMFKDIM